MDIRKREIDGGMELTVETDQKVALAVKTGEEEIIYLPSGSESDGSYYAENTSSLTRLDQGYRVLHRGKVDKIEVIC